jgi:hypothetical protein
VTTARLRLTIKRSVATLTVALGVLGFAVVRGNEALLLLLLAVPLAYLAGSLVFEPMSDLSDEGRESVTAGESRADEE